jgi:hypothetical protein
MRLWQQGRSGVEPISDRLPDVPVMTYLDLGSESYGRSAEGPSEIGDAVEWISQGMKSPPTRSHLQLLAVRVRFSGDDRNRGYRPGQEATRPW